MPTRPKTGSADRAWIEYVAELIELAGDDVDLGENLRRLATIPLEMRLLDVPAFCAGALPTFAPITVADLETGAYVEKLRAAVHAKLFYELCEEY